MKEIMRKDTFNVHCDTRIHYSEQVAPAGKRQTLLKDITKTFQIIAMFVRI